MSEGGAWVSVWEILSEMAKTFSTAAFLLIVRAFKYRQQRAGELKTVGTDRLFCLALPDLWLTMNAGEPHTVALKVSISLQK
jgi:hypothetical protein